MTQERVHRPREPRADRPTLWAVLLIGLGVLFLAGNLGWLRGVDQWLWGLLFAAGGGLILAWFLREREQWWALIPSAALFGLSTAVLGGSSGGGLFLALLGAGFAAVYAVQRTRWWAIIPAGVLLTLGVVAWLDAFFPRFDGGWVFFLGLAATFGYLYRLPDREARQRWAIYPAAATLALALVILLSGTVTGVVIPLLLIAAGVYLIWQRSTRPPTSRHTGPDTHHAPPATRPKKEA